MRCGVASRAVPPPASGWARAIPERRVAAAGRLASAVLCLAMCGCAGDGVSDPAGPEPTCTDEAPFRATLPCIQQLVFTPTCAVAGCHLGPGAQQDMDLSEGLAHSSLVGIASTEILLLRRVKPGDPEGSYLIHKLEGRPGIVGDRMPLGGPFLTLEEIGVIREWILAGAPAD